MSVTPQERYTDLNNNAENLIKIRQVVEQLLAEMYRIFSHMGEGGRCVGVIPAGVRVVHLKVI